MIDFETAKKELKQQRESVAGFTKQFFQDYLEYRKTGNTEKIFASDFYQKNGGAYCVFLEIYYAHLQNFHFEFFGGKHAPYELIAREHSRFENEEVAKDWGQKMIARGDHGLYFEVFPITG